MKKSILNHFQKSDPIIYKYLSEVKILDWISVNKNASEHDYFISLTKKIIYQQLSNKAASTIYYRFEKALNGKVTPHSILKTKTEKFREVGVSQQKTSYLFDLSQKFLNKELNLKNIKDLKDEEIINELIKVKGIGRWSAEMFLIFDLGRENVFSFGDQGLKKAIKNIYKPKDLSEKTINKIISKWIPFRTYGSIALWHSLDNL